MTYETELETKKILASIDDINNALIEEDSSTKESDIEEESEAITSTSSNIFLNLWEQILGWNLKFIVCYLICKSDSVLFTCQYIQ